MMDLQEIKNRFAGKGGIESESVLCDNNFDRDEGVVSFWSNKGDLAKVIDRCGSMIKRISPVGNGFQLFIDRKAFRGIHCAFKKIDNKGEFRSPINTEASNGEPRKRGRKKTKEAITMPFSNEKMAELANSSSNLGEMLVKVGWQDIKENRLKMSQFLAMLRKTMTVKSFPRGRQKKV